MEAILDTNFIISCLMKQIDFIEELQDKGFKIVVPREVLQEMKDLKRKDKTSRAENTAIDIALQIIETKKVKKISLGENYVDKALIAKGKEGVYIATLDKGIQRQVPNRIVIKSASKSLEIERD